MSTLSERLRAITCGELWCDARREQAAAWIEELQRRNRKFAAQAEKYCQRWMEEHAAALSLRDHFAAAALTGLLSDPNVRSRGKWSEFLEDVSEDAYEFSDSMLVARARAAEKGRKMETVCFNEPRGELAMSYPDVVHGAREWVWSDEQPPEGDTITVTVHGLRRLLRIASQAYGVAAHHLLREQGDDLYADRCTPEKLRALMNETSSIWCEGNLVMSRLFVTEDGKEIRHYNDDVDDGSAAPWAKGRADEKEES